MAKLFWQSLLAFLAVPGVVAFAIPLLVLAPRPLTGRFAAAGAPVVGVGAGLLLWCVRDFYVSGRGTLAPWVPPRELVVVGLYRMSRNPMYVSVILVLVGWAVGFRSMPLALYALTVAVGFHLRVVLGEEPWLAQTHGEKWVRYRDRVPRWLGFR